MARWQPYRENERVIGTNLTILKVIKKGSRQRDFRYLARFDCCGNEKEISQRGILQRISALHTKCMMCARKASGETRRGQPRESKPQEFFRPYYHGWKPPTSIVASTPRWL